MIQPNKMQWATKRDALDEPMLLRTSDAAAARRREAYALERDRPCPVPRCTRVLRLEGFGRHVPVTVCDEHGEVAEDRGQWLWPSFAPTSVPSSTPATEDVDAVRA